MEQIKDYPLLSQHFPHVKLHNMCTLVALAVTLEGGNVCLSNLDDMVDTALRLGITSPDVGGISAAGCVKLAIEYGKPEFGSFGPSASAEECQALIRKYIREGRPLVVMVTVNLNPKGCGHAVCIVGIDEDNNIMIHDSYSSIKCREIDGAGINTQPNSTKGEPCWVSKEGTYVVSWDEFDRLLTFFR
eukprot:TRINITY_DN2161_c0_g1_i2.p1 TRINITY_DN2161_c0_g1~~TRINITY_DN2161_c0_g1_i2.p1  ORF type:complete len:188 (-),score=13.22 TRINITY_DN2161_c0_g1_i2:292-855(-)